MQRASEDSTVQVEDAELTPAVEQRMRQVRGQFPTEEQFQDLLRRSGFGSAEEYRRWLMDEQRRNELQDRLIQKLRQ